MGEKIQAIQSKWNQKKNPQKFVVVKKIPPPRRENRNSINPNPSDPGTRNIRTYKWNVTVYRDCIH